MNCTVCGAAEEHFTGENCVEYLKSKLHSAVELASVQAEDDGLWFIAESASEAYLQQELRKLHAAIEGVTPAECARRDDTPILPLDRLLELRSAGVYREGCFDLIDLALAALKAQGSKLDQRWIPASERLPLSGRQVLVFCPLDTPTVRYLTMHMGQVNGTEWIVHDQRSITGTPTHWMPLPEPPK